MASHSPSVTSYTSGGVWAFFAIVGPEVDLQLVLVVIDNDASDARAGERDGMRLLAAVRARRFLVARNDLELADGQLIVLICANTHTQGVAYLVAT